MIGTGQTQRQMAPFMASHHPLSLSLSTTLTCLLLPLPQASRLPFKPRLLSCLPLDSLTPMALDRALPLPMRGAVLQLIAEVRVWPADSANRKEISR